MWQRAVDTQRFNPRFRNDEWRHRITGGHPDRVVLTYVGRLGAGANLIAVNMGLRFKNSMPCSCSSRWGSDRDLFIMAQCAQPALWAAFVLMSTSRSSMPAEKNLKMLR